MPRGVEKVAGQWIDDIYYNWYLNPGDWERGGGALSTATGTYFISTEFPTATNSALVFNIVQPGKLGSGGILTCRLYCTVSATSANDMNIAWQVAEADEGQDLNTATATATNTEAITDPSTAWDLVVYDYSAQVAVDDNAMFTSHRLVRTSGGDTHGGDFHIYGVRIRYFPEH